MTAAISWIEAIFDGIPLPLLEVWGSIGVEPRLPAGSTFWFELPVA